MAERAHPDLPGFKAGFSLRFRRGIVPWITYRRPGPYRLALQERYRWVAKACRGMDVLDVPCGVGWGTSMLTRCRSVFGVDIDAGAIAEARQRYGRAAEFRVGDMTRLDFPDQTFDAVVCLEGIEHISVQAGQRFLSEVDRVLRPDGRLFLSSPHCPTRAHSGNPHHVHEYQPQEIRHLLEQRFHVDEVRVRSVDVMVVHYFRLSKRASTANMARAA